VGAGTVGQKVIGYLQAHPEVNNALFTFADPEQGFPQALKAAGLANRVKILGAVENAAVVKGIEDGTVAAWTLSPNEYMGMTMVDGMARLATGQTLTSAYQDSIYHNPTWLLTTPSAAQALGSAQTWPGPAAFQTQYGKLWNIGG
jgi:ABC-type sugar transport system substrate-binding protein